MLHITSPRLITGSVYLLTTFTHLAQPTNTPCFLRSLIRCLLYAFDHPYKMAVPPIPTCYPFHLSFLWPLPLTRGDHLLPFPGTQPPGLLCLPHCCILALTPAGLQCTFAMSSTSAFCLDHRIPFVELNHKS